MSKRVKFYSMWVFSQSMQMSMVVAGTVFGVQGAMNLATVLVWIYFVTAPLFLIDVGIGILKKRGSFPPAPLDIILDISASAVLIWYGHLVLGSALIFSAIIQSAAYSKARETD